MTSFFFFYFFASVFSETVNRVSPKFTLKKKQLFFKDGFWQLTLLVNIIVDELQKYFDLFLLIE